MKDNPLIILKGITRSFYCDKVKNTVLSDINLEVHRGEMIAITGLSGSGKSTLMNILACLDRPCSGEYSYSGVDVLKLSDDEVSSLRCHKFGFVFQRYHLLSQLNVRENVILPAIYAGTSQEEREKKATELLLKLGIEKFENYDVDVLSGGQQQRVGIARALINEGEVIFADEPTGALDAENCECVMAAFQELNELGHTIILVTHSEEVAQYASRIVHVKNGTIISDTGSNDASPVAVSDNSPAIEVRQKNRSRLTVDMAIRSLVAYKMRVLLSMLGVVIGILSVVTIVSLGIGAKIKMVEQVNSMGANSIDIYPGKGWGDEEANNIQTFKSSDLLALRSLDFVDKVSPLIALNVKVSYEGAQSNGNAIGVDGEYFFIKNFKTTQGRVFNKRDLNDSAPVAVIDTKTATRLFLKNNPIDKMILIGGRPVKVIGVVEQAMNIENNMLNIWVPYSSFMTRIMYRDYFDSITVKINPDIIRPEQAEKIIDDRLTLAHGTKDFFMYSSNKIAKSVEKVTTMMTMMITGVASISLLVAGVGIMNIMLVSVSERVHEIGLRMALGARKIDVLLQIITEALVICLVGGIVGILLSLVLSYTISFFFDELYMQFSFTAVLAAFCLSTLCGLLFGYIPAKKASLMDPTQALSVR